MPTTFGVKLDETTQQRLKAVAKGLDRAPHWVIKTALTDYLNREEAALRRGKRMKPGGSGFKRPVRP